MRSGGECCSRGTRTMACPGVSETNAATHSGEASGAATATGSALTKFFRTLVVQVCLTGAERLQHPCGAFCARESSNCGQEKQFPQNSAATMSAASTELEKVLIKIVGYHSILRITRS